LQHTLDGGFILVGSSASFGNGNSDVYMVKVDSIGEYEWSKTYGGEFTDWGLSVEQTTDSGYVIAGYTNSFGTNDYDIYIVRTNSIGDSLWTKRYGSNGWDFGNDIKQTIDGGFIVAGQTSSQTSGLDAILLRLDSLGNTIWTQTYGGSKDELFNSIALTSDGSYIMTGATSSYGSGKMDTYTVKTNNLGDTLWTFVKGDTQDDIANKIIQVSDTGYVLVGTHMSFVPGWKKDFYFIKIDKNGNFIRHDSWGTDQDDYGTDVLELPNNELVTFGYIPESEDIYMSYTSANGNWIFGHTYGGNGTQEAHSIDFTNSGGFAILGTTTDFGSGYSDFYLITTDSAGKDQNGNVITNYDPDSVFLDTNHLLITYDPNLSYSIEKPVNAYPNPSSGLITIELSDIYSSQSKIRFELFDTMGNLVLQKSIVNSRILNIHKGNLAEGIYFVKIEIEINKDLIKYQNMTISFTD
jgi:hypothetical protein